MERLENKTIAEQIPGAKAYNEVNGELKLGSQTAVDYEVRELCMLPIADIKTGNNPRKHFDMVGLVALSESIKAEGIHEAITVSKDTDGVFYLKLGERRLRAAIMAGYTEIQCIVVPKEDDAKEYLAKLTENMQRKDLTALEEALAIDELLKTDLYKNNMSKLAEGMGKILGSRQRLIAKRKLLKLPPEVRKMFGKPSKTGVILTQDHAEKALFQLLSEDGTITEENKAIAIKTSAKAYTDDLSATQLKALVDKELNPTEKTKTETSAVLEGLNEYVAENGGGLKFKPTKDGGFSFTGSGAGHTELADIVRKLLGKVITEDGEILNEGDEIDHKTGQVITNMTDADLLKLDDGEDEDGGDEDTERETTSSSSMAGITIDPDVLENLETAYAEELQKRGITHFDSLKVLEDGRTSFIVHKESVEQAKALNCQVGGNGYSFIQFGLRATSVEEFVEQLGITALTGDVEGEPQGEVEPTPQTPKNEGETPADEVEIVLSEEASVKILGTPVLCRAVLRGGSVFYIDDTGEEISIQPLHMSEFKNMVLPSNGAKEPSEPSQSVHDASEDAQGSLK